MSHRVCVSSVILARQVSSGTITSLFVRPGHVAHMSPSPPSILKAVFTRKSLLSVTLQVGLVLESCVPPRSPAGQRREMPFYKAVSRNPTIPLCLTSSFLLINWLIANQISGKLEIISCGCHIFYTFYVPFYHVVGASQRYVKLSYIFTASWLILR